MRRALYLALVLVATASAQEVGSRDFPLRPKPPSTPSAGESAQDQQEAAEQKKECPGGFTVTMSDGVVTGHKADKLQLAVLSVEPRTLRPGQEFLVVVRLKNVGRTKIFIPWQTIDEPRPKPKEDAPEDQEDTGYFMVNIGTGDKREIGTAIEADSDLFGTPGENSTYHLLSRGQWITFRIHAAVRCKFPGDQSLCDAFVSDPAALLTVSWTESLYTTRREKCSVRKGSFTRREAESKPFLVAVTVDASGELK